MKKPIYNLCLFFILIFIYFVSNQINEYNIWNRFSNIIILIISIIHLFKSFHIITNSNLNNKIKDTLLFIFSSLFIIIILEIVFFFIPKSHFFGNTLASKNWRSYYNKPINKYGFHDYYPKSKKNTILFVGDSFTQGHGIKNVKDRYSNKIQEYNQTYSCINIGKNGLDTKKEFSTMLDFISKSNIKPKTIILQYFGNDIEGIAYSKIKKNSKDPYYNYSKISKFLIKGSFLINYLYWLYPHEDYKPYLRFLKKAYSDPEIVNEHLSDLNKFIQYSKDKNIKLKVLIFPFLVDFKLSDEIYEKKIITFFNSKKIETISVRKLVGKINKNDLIVNKNDGHASILLNEIIAKKIYKTLK